MRVLVFIAFAVVASAAFSSDVTAPAVAGGYDAEYELKWDNGTMGSFLAFYTGNNAWWANDFDVSTLTVRSGHNYIRQMGVAMAVSWPNTMWEGMRIAIFEWQGGIIWPTSGQPMFVRGTGSSGLYWFNVNWILPPNITHIAAGVEQFYNYPACDAICFDTGPSQHHSWQLYGGTWGPTTPNANLMIRLRFATNWSEAGVQPASLGRVKAVYY